MKKSATPDRTIGSQSWASMGGLPKPRIEGKCRPPIVSKFAGVTISAGSKPWEVAMPASRRRFLQTLAASGLVASSARAADRRPITTKQLDEVLAAPVLKLDFMEKPVTV